MSETAITHTSDSTKSVGNKFIYFLVNVFLLFLSVFLFAFSQPNAVSLKGFPFLAYIAFVPFFILLRRISFGASFLWSAFYGLFCYCVFTYWLGTFHPVAMYVIGSLYFCYLLVVGPLLKLADMFFPRKGFIIQWIIWVGYEYIKTLGFTGFSYGIIGYSQWSWPVIIQIASLFGVWGVSALVSFPSAWIAGGLKEKCTGTIKDWFGNFSVFAREHALSGCIWCVAFTGTIVFGLLSPLDYSQNATVKVALIQPNSDPWLGGLNAYQRDFNTLKRLSDAALKENPGIDMVVWPETAFIPRIAWHYRYREEPESYELVSRFLSYINSASVPFVVGNDDAVMARTYDGTMGRVDYNAVLVFHPGEDVIPPEPERYRKIHLVPFTEYFPYQKQFPDIYKLLVANDTHFWEKGTEPKVFSVADLHFSTPICFEDTFGYLSRLFVRNGARAIVNLSNDAWANNTPCQYQHLSMAVFRAVENRVPLVRATASGQTCIIDPNGKIVAMAEPFTETSLIGDIPVMTDASSTPYTIYGDLIGKIFAVLGFLFLVIGLLTKIIRKTKIRKV